MERSPQGGRGNRGIGDRVGRVGEDTRSGLRYSTRRRNALQRMKGSSPEPNPNHWLLLTSLLWCYPWVLPFLGDLPLSLVCDHSWLLSLRWNHRDWVWGSVWILRRVGSGVFDAEAISECDLLTISGGFAEESSGGSRSLFPVQSVPPSLNPAW